MITILNHAIMSASFIIPWVSAITLWLSKAST